LNRFFDFWHPLQKKNKKDLSQNQKRILISIMKSFSQENRLEGLEQVNRLFYQLIHDKQQLRANLSTNLCTQKLSVTRHLSHAKDGSQTS